MGQKRRRIALSCVDCRKRKVKCDRTYPSCIRCQKGGYGDKCLYVTHTGAEASNGLPTPEDERHEHSRAASDISWVEEADQYHDAAQSHETRAQRDEANMAEAPSLHSQHAPVSVTKTAIDPRDRRIAQLHGRLMELETMVYAAGGKPTSNEMKFGLFNPMVSGKHEPNPFSDRYALADHEKVLLRGKSFKTQYFGPSTPLAILLQFEDLSKFVRDILLTLPSFATAKHSISKIREKEKQAARQTYDISMQSLVNMVPERVLADRLLHQYLDIIETTYRIVHVPTFLRDYEAFWASPKDSKPEFVVQLLVCLSCMHCIVPSGEEGYVGRSSATRETATYWINACSYWLESQSQKHVSLVNYQLQIQLWLARGINCIKVKRIWTDSGALVRKFMASGLHREPSLLCGKINTFDCEMRRRLWYTVLELDLQVTLDRGITPTIGPNDYDTTAPLNIDDESFDIDTETLPDPKPHGNFTRTSFLVWAAENLPLRIELLHKINSIRNTLDHETINLYDHKIRACIDGVPLAGWKKAVRDETSATPAAPPFTTTTLSSTTSLIAMTLSQSILYEYITILHQTFACDSRWRSQDFHSRVARRYAAICTIQLYNPHLSVTDTSTKEPRIDKSLYLTEVQRRFFAYVRDDLLRAALSLSHSYTLSLSTSSLPFGTYVADDLRLVLMVETAVNMLGDRVRHLGQGFHGYWITSSALSFVHSKMSPDVPRSTFAHAAADRVVKLHNAVMDGQLPRARRMLLQNDDPNVLHTEVAPAPAAGENSAATQAEAISSVDGAIGIHQGGAMAAPAAVVAGIVDEGAGMMGYGLPPAPGMPDIGGGMMGFDQVDSMQDAMFGFENMDWATLMNADPTDYIGGSGNWDYPT